MALSNSPAGGESDSGSTAVHVVAAPSNYGCPAEVTPELAADLSERGVVLPSHSSSGGTIWGGGYTYGSVHNLANLGATNAVSISTIDYPAVQYSAALTPHSTPAYP